MALASSIFWDANKESAFFSRAASGWANAVREEKNKMTKQIRFIV